jgi:hypothetical protein
VKTRDPWIQKKMDAACRMADRKGGRAFLYDAYQHYGSPTSWSNMRRFWNEEYTESKKPAPPPTTPAGKAVKTPTSRTTAARAAPTGKQARKTSHQTFTHCAGRFSAWPARSKYMRTEPGRAASLGWLLGMIHVQQLGAWHPLKQARRLARAYGAHRTVPSPRNGGVQWKALVWY